MFKLSKATEYAIILLKNLNEGKGIVLSLGIIAKNNGLPLRFLERVASQLKSKKIIKSKEGLGGGYFLAKNPKLINLREVIKAVEGNKGLVSCIYGKCLSKNKCSHQQVWHKLQIILEKEVAKIKLKDFL